MRYFIFFFILALFNSCSSSSTTNSINSITKNAQPSKLLSCYWIKGNWIYATETKLITESWNSKNDSTLIGASYFIKGKDTLSHELISIERRLNKIYYIPTVSNQNGALPVRFKEKEISDSLIIFENPGHDFPQFISYQLIHIDSIVAKIYGQINGQEQRQIFPYNRLK
jgi:hypothetical protein